MSNKSDHQSNKSFSETDLDQLELQQQESSHSLQQGFVCMRSKRRREYDNISELRDEMQNMFATILAAQEREFKKNSALLQGIQKTTTNIESSISFLTTQNEEFRKRIEMLENKIKDDQKYIVTLEDKLENMQQDSRKANFEIKNVPKRPNETKDDLIKMVIDLSKSVGSTIQKSDIRDIYRIRSKKTTVTNTPIVVETTSTLQKNDLLKSCKTFSTRQRTKLAAKHLGFHTSEDTPVFVNEQLTARAARLHFLARDLAKSKSFKFCWTAYGKVFVRKDEISPVIQISCEPQVQHMLNNDK